MRRTRLLSNMPHAMGWVRGHHWAHEGWATRLLPCHVLGGGHLLDNWLTDGRAWLTWRRRDASGCRWRMVL
jgi:hypothetical protein